MKKIYTTTTEIWRKGLPVPVGTELLLADSEVKYLKHALVEKGAADVAPAEVPAEVETVSSSDIHTVEVDGEDKPAKRRK